jgi:hypothetical protein
MLAMLCVREMACDWPMLCVHVGTATLFAFAGLGPILGDVHVRLATRGGAEWEQQQHGAVDVHQPSKVEMRTRPPGVLRNENGLLETVGMGGGVGMFLQRTLEES